MSNTRNDMPFWKQEINNDDIRLTAIFRHISGKPVPVCLHFGLGCSLFYFQNINFPPWHFDLAQVLTACVNWNQNLDNFQGVLNANEIFNTVNYCPAQLIMIIVLDTDKNYRIIQQTLFFKEMD